MLPMIVMDPAADDNEPLTSMPSELLTDCTDHNRLARPCYCCAQAVNLRPCPTDRLHLPDKKLEPPYLALCTHTFPPSQKKIFALVRSYLFTIPAHWIDVNLFCLGGPNGGLVMMGHHHLTTSTTKVPLLH